VSDPLQNSLQSVIQTQHPGLAAELQGAINTLRKLQLIAGAPILPLGSPDPNATLMTTPGEASNIATHLSEPGLGFQFGMEAPELVAGESFGRYQVVRLLGKGAMGAVYLAYDGQLERHVALKLPILSNEDMTRRFYREARATASLRSPYICATYDVGDVHGMHFISMSYIEGKPLSHLIRGGELTDPVTIAEIIRKASLGLQKAHDDDLVHRDLKPDNIMVDVDGDPVLMDFGLARRLGDDATLSKIGALIGSPAYMSPEQVAGDHSKVGQATDIYSLGVVLFEMLTGQIPFQGSVMSVLRQVADKEPPRPTSIVSQLNENPRFAALEDCALKMMSKSPSDRFPNAAAVAAAMEEITQENLQKNNGGKGWLNRIWPFKAAS